jgi:hypothetical protein
MDRVLVLWRVHEQSMTGSKMKLTRFYIDYACESARRRQVGAPPITLADFQAQRDARPLWRRWGEAVNLHARCQYRVALSELYGGRRWRGSLRMAAAAFCAPRLTAERLARTLRAKRPSYNGAGVAMTAGRESEYETFDEPVTAAGGPVR